MGYLFKIAAGSKNTNSKVFTANRLPTPLFSVKLDKIYNAYNHVREMGHFSRLKSDDGTCAMITNEAVGTSDVLNELESGVSGNIIRTWDSTE